MEHKKYKAAKKQYAEKLFNYIQEGELGKTPEDTADTLFEKFSKYDPTHDKPENQAFSYISWLARTALKNKVKPEDFYKMRDDLDLFHRHKSSISKNNKKNANIDTHKTPKALADLVHEYAERKRWIKSGDPNKPSEQDAETIYKGKEGTIVSVHTMQASQYYGRGTRWCISAKMGDNLFNDYYSPQQPIYMFLPKNSKEKYAFSVKEDVLRDTADEAVARIPDDLGALVAASITSEKGQELFDNIFRIDDKKPLNDWPLRTISFWHTMPDKYPELAAKHDDIQERIKANLAENIAIIYKGNHGQIVEAQNNVARACLNIPKHISLDDAHNEEFENHKSDYCLITPSGEIHSAISLQKTNSRNLHKLPNDLQNLFIEAKLLGIMENEYKFITKPEHYDLYSSLLINLTKQKNTDGIIHFLSNEDPQIIYDIIMENPQAFKSLHEDTKFLEDLLTAPAQDDTLELFEELFIIDAIKLSKPDPQTAKQSIKVCANAGRGVRVDSHNLKELSESLLEDSDFVSDFIRATGYGVTDYRHHRPLRMAVYEVYGTTIAGAEMCKNNLADIWMDDMTFIKAHPERDKFLKGDAKKIDPTKNVYMAIHYERAESESVYMHLSGIFDEEYEQIFGQENNLFSPNRKLTDIEAQVIEDPDAFMDLEVKDITLGASALAVANDPTALQDVPPSMLKSHSAAFSPYYNKLKDGDPVKVGLQRYFKVSAQTPDKQGVDNTPKHDIG